MYFAEQECGEAVHKALHLSDPWEFFSVNIDDTETRVDIRIRSKGKVEHICPDCGCSCEGYDKRERTWQHMDFFDMECHLHCAVPRMECPKCGKVMLVDVPWAQENSGFTLLFEAKGVELMKEMPVNAAGRYLGVTDKRLWRVLDKHVEERMKHQDLSELDRFYVDETSCRRGHRYVSIFVDEIITSYSSPTATIHHLWQDSGNIWKHMGARHPT